MTAAEEIALGEAALQVIEKVYETVKAAKSGKVAPSTALASLKTLHDELAANDAAADLALHDKFDHGGQG